MSKHTGNTSQDTQSAGSNFEETGISKIYKVVEEVQFTDSSIGADSVSWDFGDGNTSTESNPLHEYTENGEYVVTLTAINEFGQSSQNQTIIVEGIGIEFYEVEQEEEQEEQEEQQENTDETSDWPNFLTQQGINNLQDLEARFGIITAELLEMMVENGIINQEQSDVISQLVGLGETQTTTTTTTETETETDDSDTGDGRPTFNYTLTGKLSGRQPGVNTTFNIDVDSVNYPTLISELSNYIGQTMTANGAPRTITDFRTNGTGGYSITLLGVVGNDTPGVRYSFSINITSLQDLNDGDTGDDNEDTGLGGRGGDDDDGGIDYEPPK